MVRKTLSGTKYFLLLTVSAVIAASVIWYSYTFVHESGSTLVSSGILSSPSWRTSSRETSLTTA